MPNTAPAAVAVATLMPKPYAATRFDSTPSRLAAVGFWTVARIARPNRVCWSIRYSSARITQEAAKAASRTTDTSYPNTVSESFTYDGRVAR